MPKSIAATPGISSEAVRARTGRDWSEWFGLLDGAKATALSHKEIAKLLNTKFGASPWWAQMITVEYERARGMRERYETLSGFRAGLSRTLDVPLEELWKHWSLKSRRAKWLDAPFEITGSTTHKSARLSWPDGSRVDLNFFAKGESKSMLQVEHTKLKNAREVTASKAFWSNALENLKASAKLPSSK